MPARRADKAGWPSQPFQVVKTIGIRQEPSLKFPKKLRVVNAGARTSHPLSLRPTPVKWIPHVTGRHNGATDGRHNGATKKCRNRALEPGQDWAIFAPFATGFFGASGRGLGAR